MAITGDSNDRIDNRIEWVEPEIVELNVTETHRRPRFGRDGGQFADCQRS